MDKAIYNPDLCKICGHRKYCKKYKKNIIKKEGCICFKPTN